MIVILGLVILLAAGIAGATGVLANGGHAHAVTHFAVFGYHVTGSTGTLFLYGIVTGALAIAGLCLLLAGAAPYLAPRPRRPPRAGTVPSRDRRRQPGARRPDRPARHCPRLHGPRRTTELHRQHAGRRRHRPERQRSGPARAQPLRAPVRAPAAHPQAAPQPAPLPSQAPAPAAQPAPPAGQAAAVPAGPPAPAPAQ